MTQDAGASSHPSHARIKRLCLSYPEAHEDHPWGESVIKVRKKVFVFLGVAGPELSFSVKLPESQDFALILPNTQPTGYGLGKSGWITVRFRSSEKPPMDIIEEWIDESYRAVAPKKLIKQLNRASTENDPASVKRNPGRKKSVKK